MVGHSEMNGGVVLKVRLRLTSLDFDRQAWSRGERYYNKCKGQ